MYKRQAHYPTRARQKHLFSYQQPKGVITTDHFNELEKRAELADLANMTYESCLANLAINSLTDQKMKAELMKVANPTIKTLRERAEEVQREAREIAYGESGPSQTKSKAYAVSGSQDKPKGEMKCFFCGKKGHKAHACTTDRKTLHCKGCDTQGHVESVCRKSKRTPATASPSRPATKPAFAKAATEVAPPPVEGETIITANMARAERTTPPLIL